MRLAGVQEVTIETVLLEINILVSSAGNFNIITSVHMKRLKNNAFAGYTGHFVNDFDLTEFSRNVPCASEHHTLCRQWLLPSSTYFCVILLFDR